jgi:LCP family protein required for cell wall assembly
VATLARHGRLRRRRAVGAILSGVAIALAVVLVSGASLGAYAVWHLTSNLKPGVDISFVGGAAPPAVGAIQGPVNILLVGSDSGGGDVKTFGKRGENLNDVTMLLHISPLSHTAIAVSFPRDMYVPISGCSHSPGTRKINEALTNGGLACAVSTVSALTGLDIGYAAQIEFQGVIGMSDAIGGVEVCVGKPIHDLQIGLTLSAGQHTLQGFEALQFLRSRHGINGGSDTSRISNQQLFLSALMRKVKSSDVLTNPITLYKLANAATQNMTLSTSLNHLDTMVSIAAALKDVSLSSMVFAQYPTGSTVVNGVGGLLPRKADAQVLMSAIAADRPVVVAGVGGGTIAGGDVVETPAPAPSGSATAGRGATPPASPTPTVPTGGPVTLPRSITGQAAAEQTCSSGQTF